MHLALSTVNTSITLLMCATASASMCAVMVSTGTPVAVDACLSIATALSAITSTLIQIIVNVLNSLVQMVICGTLKSASANANIRQIAGTLMELVILMQNTILIHLPAAAVAST